jgi:hypothetical protein
MSHPYSVGGTPTPEEWQAKQRLVDQGLMNGAGTAYGQRQSTSYEAPWSPPPSNIFGTSGGPRIRAHRDADSNRVDSDSPVARFLGRLVGGGLMLLIVYFAVASLVAKGLVALGMNSAMAAQVSVWWLPGLAGVIATVAAIWWVRRYRTRAQASRTAADAAAAAQLKSRRQKVRIRPPSARR